MKYDFGFFEESLHTLRRLRSYSIDKSYLLDAPGQVFPELETGMAPKVLEGGEDDPSQVILVRSYARKPGKGLAKLEALLRNRLPDDFLEFHRLYDEALVSTRTYPIHLWNEEIPADQYVYLGYAAKMTDNAPGGGTQIWVDDTTASNIDWAAAATTATVLPP